ncbi:N-acetylmuramoyl-L-alanine amidase [Pelagibacteraceae bacterium]|nr:N-acetylmuramoyl-L-alanine amidase [Pelagibacteraceae bacterium]
MKYITTYKSPNYNSRKNSKIKLIIIHYTALKDTSEAISYLCNKEKKVSSHYLISQDGKVYSLVDDRFRAWHAGQAFWQNKSDINSISIGIELDYSPYGKNNRFTSEMISSLKKLILKKQKKFKINKANVLAHSDVAPFRKKDPGKFFPWHLLSSSKIISNFKILKKNEIKIIEKWFSNCNIKTKKQKKILALSLIGYDTREVYNNQRLYNKLIESYISRYSKNGVIIKSKLIYKKIITHLFNFMLTKN